MPPETPGRHQRTLDVLWIWYCHVINTDLYRRDCIRAFGEVPDWAGVFRCQGDAATAEVSTKKKLILRAMKGVASGVLHPSLDLVSAACRQRCFLEQLEPYFDCTPRQMHMMFKRYKRFLKLCRRFPNETLVRSRQISMSVSFPDLCTLFRG